MLQRHFRAYVLGNVYLMISWDLLGIELRQIADLIRALCTGYSFLDEHNILQINPKYDDRLFVELHIYDVLFYIKLS